MSVRDRDLEDFLRAVLDERGQSYLVAESEIVVLRTGDEDQAGLLTEDEHEAIKLAGRLMGAIKRIAGTHEQVVGADLAEVAAKIHDLQHLVMAQAAARVYPDRYRLLGDLPATWPISKDAASE